MAPAKSCQNLRLAGIFHHFTLACALRLGCTGEAGQSLYLVNLFHCLLQLIQGSQVDIVRALATTPSGQQEAELTSLPGYVQSDKYVVLLLTLFATPRHWARQHSWIPRSKTHVLKTRDLWCEKANSSKQHNYSFALVTPWGETTIKDFDGLVSSKNSENYPFINTPIIKWQDNLHNYSSVYSAKRNKNTYIN